MLFNFFFPDTTSLITSLLLTGAGSWWRRWYRLGWRWRSCFEASRPLTHPLPNSLCSSSPPGAAALPSNYHPSGMGHESQTVSHHSGGAGCACRRDPTKAYRSRCVEIVTDYQQSVRAAPAPFLSRSCMRARWDGRARWAEPQSRCAWSCRFCYTHYCNKWGAAFQAEIKEPVFAAGLDSTIGYPDEWARLSGGISRWKGSFHRLKVGHLRP